MDFVLLVGSGPNVGSPSVTPGPVYPIVGLNVSTWRLVTISRMNFGMRIDDHLKRG